VSFLFSFAIILRNQYCGSGDPDPQDLYVFGPPESGSISQIYGSGFFYHQAKIVRKPIIPTVL
jgi:hypothetical protein